MLLGKAAKGRVVKPINSVDESGYVYPLNVVEINGHKNQYAFVNRIYRFNNSKFC